MNKLLAPYQPILEIPGTRALLVVAFAARLPLTAKAMALTLHIVLDQGGSYAAAGLVSMVMTVGMGVGAPLAGTVVDAASPAWSFATTGAIGAALAGTMLAYQRFAATRERRAAVGVVSGGGAGVGVGVGGGAIDAAEAAAC